MVSGTIPYSPLNNYTSNLSLLGKHPGWNPLKEPTQIYSDLQRACSIQLGIPSNVWALVNTGIDGNKQWLTMKGSGYVLP